MSSIIYNERADHIDTMAKQGKEIERLKAEIERMQFENQHVIWLKHRNEALDKNNKQLRALLKECKPLFFPYVNEAPLSAKRHKELLTRINTAIGESEE